MATSETASPEVEVDCTDGAVVQTRGRGRPLNADRTDAILAAAGDLFDELGYDQLRVQDIADRAGVGLATLYRRWPTKQALLAEALRHKNDSFVDPLEGTPVEVLRRIFEIVAHRTLGPDGEFLPGLLTAIRADDDLAEALRVGVLDPLAARIRAELVELVGADHPQLDLLVDLVPSVCVYRALAPGDPGDPEVLVADALALVAGLGVGGPVEA